MCLIQGFSPPPALNEMSRYLRTGFMGDMAFRVIRLKKMITCADAVSGEIYNTASVMEQELHLWRASIPPEWMYSHTSNGSRHVYASLWHAQTWNNWRTLRILCSRVMYDFGDNSEDQDTHMSVVREMSANICITSLNFSGSSRKSSILHRAVCTHKARVQTLQRAKVDLGSAFECGHAYVALARSIHGSPCTATRPADELWMAHMRKNLVEFD